MLAHKTMLVTKADPFKYITKNLIPSSRITKWMLVLNEFDIIVVAPKAKKSEALAYLLPIFPSQGEEIVEQPIPRGLEEIFIVEAKKWELTFECTSTSERGGVGIVMTGPEGQVTMKVYKLTFGCSNNEKE